MKGRETMKEVTRIVTLEITAIKLVEGDPKSFNKSRCEEAIKKFTHADDVHVKNVQDFIIDKDDCNE